MAERDRLFERASRHDQVHCWRTWGGTGTTWAGWAAMLDRLPNVYPETAAILYELGRQPRDREGVLYRRIRTGCYSGRTPTVASEFPYYWRTFETADEYFDYYRRYHAFWKLYGMDLPDDVLQKVYYKNALKVVPGIAREQFPM